MSDDIGVEGDAAAGEVALIEADIESGRLRESGNLAMWTVSSAKPGFEIEVVRDDSHQTFWQSDGPQPHYINIHFVRRVALKCLSIYMDYTQDESYTPAKFAIRAGTCYHDLQEVSVIDVHEPRGWKHIDLGALGKDGLLRVWLVQVCILLNHQNGKDTHVRNIRLYSPRSQVQSSTNAVVPSSGQIGSMASFDDEMTFGSQTMRAFEVR